jgi:hypothetical protein
MIFGKGKKALSADQKLEIRDEVERRLKELPAETLRIIEREVSERVEAKARHYRTLITVAGILLGLLVVTVTGITWSNLLERTDEVIRVHSDVESAKTNILSSYATISNTVAIAGSSIVTLSNRIHELEGMDNVVTAEKLKKELEVVREIRKQSEEALLAVLRMAAMNGDAVAYDRLKTWATNSESLLAFEAQRAVTQISMSILGPFYPENEHAVSVGRQWDMGIGFEASVDNMYHNSEPEIRSSIIKTIGTATNFPLSKRIGFLVDATLRCPTIQGRVVASRLLNDITKEWFHPSNPTYLEKWWETSKVKYVEAEIQRPQD